MASVLICLGRFAFFVLYPAVYSIVAFYALIFLFIAALVLWLSILCNEENLQWLFTVWPAYVWIALIPLIGIIFGGKDPIENKLDSQVFLGCECLEDDPVFISLTFITVIKYRHWFHVIQRFDLAALLENSIGSLRYSRNVGSCLEENIVPHNIPRSFENAIITFALISLFLSLLQLMEIKLTRGKKWKYREVISICHKTLQILVVNGVFLGLHLALFLEYGKDASIFLAKNGIVILRSLFEICSECECCGCSD